MSVTDDEMDQALAKATGIDPAKLLPDPTNTQQQRHEDDYSYEQYRDAHRWEGADDRD